MSSRFTLRRFMLAIAFLALVTAGCVEPLHPFGPGEGGAGYLPIEVYLPDMPAQTKSSGGMVTSREMESSLYDLQIWAFTHQAPDATASDYEGAVAYMCLPAISSSETLTGILTVSLRIPDYVMSRPDSLLKFDFYVLGNGRSVGFDLASEATARLTRGDLKNKVFGDNDGSGFGASIVTAVPDGSTEGKGKGLPMTGFFNNDGEGFDLSFLKYEFTTDQMTYVKNHHGQPYDADDPDFLALGLSSGQKSYLVGHCVVAGVWNWFRLSPSVLLTRAVSKLRFVFAKSQGMTETQITSVELIDYTDDSGVIPTQSYLFDREAEPLSGIALPVNSYETVTMGSERLPLLLDDEIKEDPNPARLSGSSVIVDPYFGQPSSMSAQQYDEFLTSWIGDATTTEKLLYLRETDRPIKGRIHYKMGEKRGTATFNMIAAGSDHLYRNGTWTIFAYYLTDPRRLEVETFVLPWDDKVGGSTGILEPVNVDQDGKFLVDPNTATIDHFVVQVPSLPDSAAIARVVIYSPEGGQLLIHPKGDADAFDIRIVDKDGNSPDGVDQINRNRDGGRMYIRVARSSDPGKAVSGKSMQLSFRIKLPGGRIISADSELIDENYTFVIP